LGVGSANEWGCSDTQMLLSYRLHTGTVYFQRGNVAIDYSKHFTELVKLN
jgi:hypothetical protein